MLAFPNFVTIQERDASGKRIWRTKRTAHVWVLRRGYDPIMVTPEDGAPSLLALQQHFDRFCKGLEGRGTAMRRAAPMVARTDASQDTSGLNDMQTMGLSSPVRKAPSETFGQSDPISEEIPGLTALEMTTFWSEFEAGMAAAVWRPLAKNGYLDGIGRVLLATAGDMHNLPLGVGLATHGPKGVSLSHVGSLAQFAVGRGLLRSDAEQSAADDGGIAQPIPCPHHPRSHRRASASG